MAEAAVGRGAGACACRATHKPARKVGDFSSVRPFGRALLPSVDAAGRLPTLAALRSSRGLFNFNELLMMLQSVWLLAETGGVGLDGAKPISAERACALFEEVTGAGETEPRLSSTNRETPIVFDEFVRFFAALAEVVFASAAPTVPARARHMFAFLIVATRLAGGPSDPKWGC